jgi:phenol 2-monooxygenase
MNVSMMDSYNLAWKMTHTLHGLRHSSTVSRTLEDERLAVAKQLIEFDSKFSSMFSGQIGSETPVESLSHSEFLKVFSDGSGFTSGCGVEYSQGILVKLTTTKSSANPSPITGDDYLQGVCY